MKARTFDPHKLELVAFARDAASLQGEWPAASFERLADSAAADAPASQWPPVKWVARGERREMRGGDAQTWLQLDVESTAQLTCQRCLKPVQEDVKFSRWFRFVSDEATAAELDVDSEEDLLTLSRSFDLAGLIEDELLLDLPLVPRHEVCPQPLVALLEDDADVEDERPNPFAALAALKKSTPQ